MTTAWDRGPAAHKTLATLEIDGVEQAILRDDMPLGRAGSGEFGTSSATPDGCR